jgi:hypothetical protein
VSPRSSPRKGSGGCCATPNRPRASHRPPGRDTQRPRTGTLDLDTWPARVETGKAGLLLLVPDLLALDLPALVGKAGYPGTRVVPPMGWLLPRR